MSDIKVKSHIQMPKSILRQFENADHNLFYYDVKSDKIKLGHAKSLNREYDYYSIETERFLSEYVEAPFGIIIQYLKDNDFEQPIDKPDNINDVVFKYVHALIARGPSIIKYITQSTSFFQLNSKRDQHDYAVMEVFNLAQQNGLFFDHFITFAVNKSTTPFVLPTGGLYNFDRIIVSPITPTKAVVLVKRNPEIEKQIIDGTVSRVFLLDKDEDVIKMNKRALEIEILKDRQYVVAPNKDVLENLVLLRKSQ